MQSITDATAIIFDIRQHRGGGTQVIDAIVSYLFDERTHMVTMMVEASVALETVLNMMDAEPDHRK